MFDDLNAAWVTEIYKSYKAILIPSMKKQLSISGLMIDLDSLPVKPYPFKELFIRWLIVLNKDRIDKNLPVVITLSIVKMCPLWSIVKCPLKKIKLTKEGLFQTTKNNPTIGTVSTLGSINKPQGPKRP